MEITDLALQKKNRLIGIANSAILPIFMSSQYFRYTQLHLQDCIEKYALKKKKNCYMTLYKTEIITLNI